MIRLNGITPEKSRAFDEVKAQIETDLKRQKVGQKFASAADQFQNLVYEQADSLAPVAKALGLTIQTSPLVTRAQAQQIALGSAKLVQALFSPESIAAKRNTDAIEVGNGAMMAARIVEYKPSAVRPFAEVKAEIHRQLVQGPLPSSRRRPAATSSRCWRRARATRKRASCSRSRSCWLRNQPQPGFTNEGHHADLPGRPDEAAGLCRHAGRRRRIRDLSAREGDLAAGSRSRPRSRRRARGSARCRTRELFEAYVNTLKAKAKVEINQANLEKK